MVGSARFSAFLRAEALTTSLGRGRPEPKPRADLLPLEGRGKRGGETRTYPILTVTVAFVVIPALMALMV